MSEMDMYYANKSDDELCEIIQDYQASKEDGRRVESFVPHAKMLFENLNLDVTSPTISLRVCIDLSKQSFFEEVCKRFLAEQKGEEV